MTIQWWQQQNDNLFYCDYPVKMFHCSNRGESKRICVIEIVGSVPRKHSVGCLNKKVFLLNYDMGTLIQIELSARLSPDIFTITQPLLWDQDKKGERASSNNVKEFHNFSMSFTVWTNRGRYFLTNCVWNPQQYNWNNLNIIFSVYFLLLLTTLCVLKCISVQTNSTFWTAVI